MINKLLIYNESDKKKFELLNNMELEEKIIEFNIDSDYLFLFLSQRTRIILSLLYLFNLFFPLRERINI